MKKILVLCAVISCLFVTCKKNDDDDNSGGGGGGATAAKYIVKVPNLCPTGTGFFIGHKLAGNLQDRIITMTISDTLNSWYLHPLGNNDYIVYAPLGNQFVVWKEGPTQPFLDILQTKGLLLAKTSTVPVSGTPPDLIFTITIDPATGLSSVISKASGQRCTPYRGGKKLPAGGNECTISGPPTITNVTGCIEHSEPPNIVLYCFTNDFIFQKVN